MNIWKFPYFINKPSLVPIGIQLFKWGHFHIFSLSYNLTSDDLWPWYVTFDLINKWGFSCCIYDPTLVEIHQSMRKLEPNVNLFSQQQDNRQQQWTKWSLCVFPAKAGDTKRTSVCITSALSYNLSSLVSVYTTDWKSSIIETLFKGWRISFKIKIRVEKKNTTKCILLGWLSKVIFTLTESPSALHQCTQNVRSPINYHQIWLCQVLNSMSFDTIPLCQTWLQSSSLLFCGFCLITLSHETRSI